MKTTLNKFHLDAVPFEAFSDAPSPEGMAELAGKLALTSHTSWFMPQLMAKFGSFTPVRNDTGKYSPKDTLIRNIGEDARLRGMYLVACRMNRSALLKGQTAAANAPYNSLVPLILASFKAHQNIEYSEWDTSTINLMVDKNLFAAMSYFSDENPMPKYTKERLLELRDHGLQYRTGPKAGTSRTVLGSWTLVGMKGTEFEDYPSLLMTMLTQIWVAHPSIRHQYMILDPVNWSNTPEPLIDTSMGIVSPPVMLKPKKSADLFWD